MKASRCLPQAPVISARRPPCRASPYVVMPGRCRTGRSWSQLARRGTAPHRLVMRARIVLLAADGLANCVIAARLGICDDTVRKWRRRYCQQGLDGLADAPRPGRPRKFAAQVAAEVKALACELPAASGTAAGPVELPRAGPRGSRRRHHPGGLGVHGAPMAGRRRAQALAAPVVDLPPRPVLRPQGRPRAGPVPADLGRPAAGRRRVRDQRRRETRRPGPPADPPAAAARHRGRAMRAESEYARGGTLAYLAAYDVHHARVIGRCEPTTGIKPFTALVNQVMATEPYASARRVFWVVDNGASHRNWAAAARLSDAYPNAQMVHLPVHASWLNQVEIYFSVIQRKLLTPDDFADLDILASQILAFEDHYNATARPFDWKFTRTDLNQLLNRLARHDPAAPPPLAA